MNLQREIVNDRTVNIVVRMLGAGCLGLTEKRCENKLGGSEKFRKCFLELSTKDW